MDLVFLYGMPDPANHPAQGKKRTGSSFGQVERLRQCHYPNLKRWSLAEQIAGRFHQGLYHSHDW
jgi:hypothetical protein